jgi:hypothetical protein
MRSRILTAALVGLVLLPSGVIAQQRSSDMELRQPRRPTVVHPPVSKELETAVQDAETARGEIAARTQANQLMRDGIGFPRQRPDLGYDVTGGIQSQRTNKALKK